MTGKNTFLLLIFVLAGLITAKAQKDPEIVIVRPVEIFDVLNNPGIGFTTFQRFNGDELNEGIGWTEGLPIEYQPFDGDVTNKNYPQTTIAYFRVNWRFLETEPEQYNWEIIDKAMRIAAERGQTLMLRISPYEKSKEKDVPDWYREMVGEEEGLEGKHWNVDPENPLYVKYFGGMIKNLGQRYDGHPNLESVDISFIGYWGEGSGGHLLTDKTRKALINIYLDNFKKTHLIFQPLNGDPPDPSFLVKDTKVAAYWPNGSNNGTGPEMQHLGWRIDCLGDMGFNPGWGCHMLDIYPQHIIKSGMSEAWKRAPVTMEICGTFLRWKEKEKYNDETVEYIFGQALKWHISSFNAKSSPVPEEWNPLVNKWLNKMGYRYVLRKFTFPSVVSPQGQLPITSWWENKGVAPIYKDYVLVIRIINPDKEVILPACVDIKTWLPGDVVYDDNLYIPYDMPIGIYQLELGIVSPTTYKPMVKLAIEGVTEDGWYPMGKIEVKNN